MHEEKRFRVFAGPNGSGKSTAIDSVRAIRINDVPIDFGTYINADEIARLLRAGPFPLSDYDVSASASDLIEFARQKGIITYQDDISILPLIFEIRGIVLEIIPYSTFRKQNPNWEYFGQIPSPAIFDELISRLAQILALFLVENLLRSGRKLSFETVFSHPSKIDLLKMASELGYKVYLYFVATESYKINIERVRIRVKQGGHNVDEERIKKRYSRSLENLFEATPHAYQAFFFDNSESSLRLVAQFKVENGEQKWKYDENHQAVIWFQKYYTQVTNSQ